MPKKTTKKTNKRQKIVLLDSHAILHRAYHALPDFSSSKGEPTGAIYGLSMMIISIIKQFKPDYILAAFDLPKPTYRHEAYADYKAGRKKSDPELVSQIKRAYDFYKAFNIPVYEVEGYEADDVLGTLAQELKKDNDVIIASGDMDTLQLVDKDKVKVFTLKKGIKDTIIYNEDAVMERFGFGPKLLPDYKGLRGDSSDNIIGIAGIGEKTATTLITEFGSIEKIYKSLKKDQESFDKAGVKPRIQNLLKENKEEAEFSKMLATIQCDVPIDYKLPKEKWLDKVSVEKINKLFMDLEFRTLSARLKDIIPDADKKIPDSGLGGLFSQGEGDDAKNKEYDPKLLEEAKVALWLINSSVTNPDVEDILNHTNENDLDKAYKKLQKEMKEKGVIDLFEKIEKPLTAIIRKMEKNGVKVNKTFLEKLSKEYHKELDQLQKDIYKMSGEEFNINSPQQLAEVLFNKMELKYKGMRKTSTGKFSTKEEVLQKLRPEHKIVDKILEHREIQKLVSTYVDNIPKLVSEKDGRLHATFLQTGTTTGRMASNNPNLQNIPIGSERGRKIRKGFIPEKGNAFCAFDYSQVELRIAAFLSGDEKLISVFKEGRDIHSAVASEVFDVSEDEVTKEMRRQAKVINFGILYGMGVNALKDNLGSDRKTAQEFYNKYFEVYSGLANYLESTKKEAAKTGFTTTLFGRRRYFEGFKSKLPFIRAAAERMAINAPIQGTSADLIKLAMVEIDKYLVENKLESKIKLILQIHDEVIYEVDKEKVDEHAPKIKQIMEDIIDTKKTRGIKLEADYLVGSSWKDL
jgi:DNA polymerase-1